ncbi:MAG: hypothetical protein PHG67_12790 [Bacteroidales bacterium]|nr:hypothetical protein [Bacteroidales bacterium]
MKSLKFLKSLCIRLEELYELIEIKTTKGVYICGMMLDIDDKSEHIRSYKQAEKKRQRQYDNEIFAA